MSSVTADAPTRKPPQQPAVLATLVLTEDNYEQLNEYANKVHTLLRNWRPEPVSYVGCIANIATIAACFATGETEWQAAGRIYSIVHVHPKEGAIQ